MRNYHFSFLMRALVLLALAFPFGLSASTAHAQEQILVGVLAASAGQTERRGENGQFEVITTGDQIYLNDEIRTPENGRIQILLMDETTFSMGADSTIVVDEFIYDPGNQSGAVSATIKKGVFRFISGRIAKTTPENMKVTAGNAVISIRGTEVIGTVAPEQSTIVLLSGLIDMTSISAGCGGGTSTAAGCQSTLVRPGFGVAVNAGGQFSPPTRFAPEDIDAVIDSIESTPEQKEDEDANPDDTPDEGSEENPADNQDESTGDGQPSDETSTDETTLSENQEPAEETSQQTAETEPQTETDPPTEPEAGVETDANGDPKTTDTPTEAPAVVLTTIEDGENLAPDGTEKIETDDKKQEPSKFDLIVLRSFGMINDDQEDDQKALTETMADVSTNLIDDKKEEDKPANSEPDTRETVEDDVDEAVEKLDEEKKEEEQKTTRDESGSTPTSSDDGSSTPANTAPTLTALTTINFEDTNADDSFNTNSANADGNDADGDSIEYSINNMQADASRSGFTHSTDGTFGKLYINKSTGAYAFVPDDGAIETLKSDTSESFTITVDDGRDNAQETLTIAVTGVNDTPVLSALTSVLIEDTASDDSFSTTSANLDGSDRDDTALTYSLTNANTSSSLDGFDRSLAGDYGTLHLNSQTGAYTYVPDDSAIEGTSTTVTEDFTLNVRDGAAYAQQTLTVEVKGANDTPELAALTGISFSDTNADDSFSTANASLSASDRDTGSSLSYGANGASADTSLSGFTHSVAGDYGTLYLNSSNGDYRYVPDDAAIEGLTAAAADAFTLSVTDGTASASQTLTASITGVNDAPVLSSISSLSFEDTAADNSFDAATNSLSATDRDSGQSLTYSISGASADTSLDGYTHALAGDYGTLYINQSSGAFSYVPDDAAIEGLSGGSASDAFTLAVSDGTASTTQTLTANVTGANDTPILNAASGFSFTDTSADDSFSTATAALDASDADTGASLSYGLIDGAVNTSITFACGGQTCSSSHAKTGTYGTLYLDETTGAYAYVPNDTAIEKTSSSVSEDFTLTVSDGTSTVSETVTASVVGVNDTPTMASLAGLTITDTAANDSFSATTAAAISASDRDGGQTLSYGINSGSADTTLSGYTHSLEGDYGRLYLNASSGAYTYVPDDSTVNSLTGSETDTFTLSATDGSATATQTLTATVNGANDTPTLASIATITVTDTSANDSFNATTATLDGADRDAGQSLTYALEESSADTSQSGYTHSKAGDYGTLYIEASSGDYTYIPNDSAIEALSSGTVSDSFNLTVSDGSLLAAQSLKVNVTGVNDTPELDAITGISFSDTASDDRFSVTNGSFSGSDRDRGANIIYTIDGSSVADSNEFSHVKQTTYGQLFYDETTGAYRFRPSDHLVNAASANVSEQITVNVTDGTGSSSQNLTVSITGVDDRPMISSEDINSQNVSSSGYRLSVTDAESQTITDISSSLPAWLTFRSSTVGNEVEYYWEVGENSPAWLNGSATVNLQAEANGLSSATRNATFVFTCGSDLCDDFIKSSDASTPRAVTDSSDQLNYLEIDGEVFSYFKTADIDNLFDSSKSNTGQFRVVYTANEANGGSGVWTIDQTVIADYQKREITVNGTVDVDKLTYFDDASDSFTYSNLIDFSGGGSTYQTGLYRETSYSNSDDFTGYEMVNKDGQTVNLFFTDYVGYLNDDKGNNASVIYSTIQTLSSNPDGYNENWRDLVEEEWRVLEPQSRGL